MISPSRPLGQTGGQGRVDALAAGWHPHLGRWPAASVPVPDRAGRFVKSNHAKRKDNRTQTH